jgi:hypothetical protein
MFQIKVAEKIKTTQNVQLLFSENRVVYHIIRRNVVESERRQKLCRPRVVCWIIRLPARKHTPAPLHSHPYARTRMSSHRTRVRSLTHAEKYNIYCFSTTTMIRECASMLRYTYIACLVNGFFPVNFLCIPG